MFFVHFVSGKLEDTAGIIIARQRADDCQQYFIGATYFMLTCEFLMKIHRRRVAVQEHKAGREDGRRDGCDGL